MIVGDNIYRVKSYFYIERSWLVLAQPQKFRSHFNYPDYNRMMTGDRGSYWKCVELCQPVAGGAPRRDDCFSLFDISKVNWYRSNQNWSHFSITTRSWLPTAAGRGSNSLIPGPQKTVSVVSGTRHKTGLFVCMMQVQPDQTLCYGLQTYFTTYCFYCFLMKWTAHLITSIVYS